MPLRRRRRFRMTPPLTRARPIPIQGAWGAAQPPAAAPAFATPDGSHMGHATHQTVAAVGPSTRVPLLSGPPRNVYVDGRPNRTVQIRTPTAADDASAPDPQPLLSALPGRPGHPCFDAHSADAGSASLSHPRQQPSRTRPPCEYRCCRVLSGRPQPAVSRRPQSYRWGLPPNPHPNHMSAGTPKEGRVGVGPFSRSGQCGLGTRTNTAAAGPLWQTRPPSRRHPYEYRWVCLQSPAAAIPCATPKAWPLLRDPRLPRGQSGTEPRT